MKTDSFVELTINDLHSLHDTPFLKEQNRFRIQIPGVTNKSAYNENRLLTLLNNPSVIELANTIIKSNGGSKVSIGDTTYLLLSVVCHNISQSTHSSNIVLTLHLKVYKNDGEKPNTLRATTSLSNLSVDNEHSSEAQEDIALLVEIKDVENVSRMMIYYSLLAISTVCENLDIAEKILSPPITELSGRETIFAMIPSRFSADAQFKENTTKSIVNCVSQAIEDKRTLVQCKQELLCIGVLPSSIDSLYQYFKTGTLVTLTSSDIEVVSGRPNNFKLHCYQGNTKL